MILLVLALLYENGRPATFEYEWVWNKSTAQPAHVRALLEHIRNIASGAEIRSTKSSSNIRSLSSATCAHSDRCTG